MQLRELGKTGIQLSPIGLGCWQFSEPKGLAGGVWNRPDDTNLQSIVETAIKEGITWFDTAELYGNGTSEQALAKALSALGVKQGEVFVATKWWPILRRASNLAACVPIREAALSPYKIDLLQIHQPWSLSSAEKQAAALAHIMRAGSVRAVGVSNFSAKLMRKVHRVLNEEGLLLASNQVRYSLNHRHIEKNGVLATAKELGVSIIAWSPLSQGLLTGRFHLDAKARSNIHFMRKSIGGLSDEGIRKTRQLIEVLGEIARVQSCSIAQVALAATLQIQGDIVFAIPGASKIRQAQEAGQTLKVELRKDQIKAIDEESRRFM